MNSADKVAIIKAVDRLDSLSEWNSMEYLKKFGITLSQARKNEKMIIQEIISRN